MRTFDPYIHPNHDVVGYVRDADGMMGLLTVSRGTQFGFLHRFDRTSPFITTDRMPELAAIADRGSNDSLDRCLQIMATLKLTRQEIADAVRYTIPIWDRSRTTRYLCRLGSLNANERQRLLSFLEGQLDAHHAARVTGD